MKIPVSHLKDGQYSYTLEEKPGALEFADDGTFTRPVKAKVDVEKRGEQLYIKIQAGARAEVICDRCLESFQLDVQDECEFAYTADKRDVDEDNDELRYRSPSEGEIDLTADVRQTVLLGMPGKKLCQPECKGICSECGENLNKTACNCQQERVDPRWQALESLKKNLEK